MPPRIKLGTEPYPYLPKRMCECASPKVLRASRRSGVLIIPKSAPLLNLEGWLIDATGYAPGLPSPMRPISVLAQNLGGIPRVLIQVLFSLPTCLLKGGVAKSYEGMQNACLLCGQKHWPNPLSQPTNPAKIAGKGWDSDTPPTGPTHPTVAPSWWASAGQLALAPTQDYHSYTHTLLGVAKRKFSRVLATHL